MRLRPDYTLSKATYQGLLGDVLLHNCIEIEAKSDCLWINLLCLKILLAEVFLMNLTTKERLLLEDQKTHEELCIQKYTNYANLTSDPQLKGIFNNNANIEREHLNTLNQILADQVPQMNQQGSSNQQQQQSQQNQQQGSFMPQGNTQDYKNSDKDLCIDMLSTEKYVSGTYDTAIFEFRDPQIRNALNHIQKEEQQHGESIFNYMSSKGMYQTQ